jgi:hypothetical protein
MSKPTSLKNLVKSEKISVSLKTLLESVSGLRRIANLKLPVAVSFKIGKTMKTIDNELNSYNEVKNKRIKELGEVGKDENGDPTSNYTVKKENMETWEKENKELIEREVELEVYKLSLSDLGEEKLEPFVFSQLDWLITE